MNKLTILSLLICVILIFICFSPSSTSINTQDIIAPSNSFNEDITILQWQGQYGSYGDYKSKKDIKPVRIQEFKQSIIVPDNPAIIVFVNSDLLSNIAVEIDEYSSTLASFGYNVIVLSVTGGTVEDLKNQILSYVNGGQDVIGAVLFGDLPVAWYHHEWDFDHNDDGLGDPSEFPCDLFLMDLDGQWTDSDDDDMYDQHTNGAGDTAPEIYVGRIDASNIPGNEVEITKKFLNKVHEFWMGNLVHTDRGLTYTDKDWSGFSDMKNDINFAYMNYEAVWFPDVERDDYVENRLPSVYEFIQLACHSWSNGHSFENGGIASSDVLRMAPPMALFYNLFCCGTLRFTDYNCVGNAYILGTNSPSLSVVGSTKSGSMLNFRYFYEPIGHGDSFGMAFQKWFEHEYPYSDDEDGYNEVSWYYGMTILGDPTLIPTIRLDPNTVHVDDDYNSSTFGWQFNRFDNIQDGIDRAPEDGDVLVYNGVYIENIVIDKAINLIGENRDTTIIEGGSNGDVVTVTGDNVSISHYTIKNSGTNDWDTGLNISSNYCTITENNIINNNRYGIIIRDFSNNAVYHNNFVDNTNNAFDNNLNIWDDDYPSGGNYWDDYGGVDANDDGIGDTPYSIPDNGNQDNYPYMNQNGWNKPPNIPTPFNPEDGEVDVAIYTDLSWIGGDPDEGDTVRYDIYLGTTSPPTLAESDHLSAYYDPGTLEYSTKYYWQIVATDNYDKATSSPIWEFTTEDAKPDLKISEIIGGLRISAVIQNNGDGEAENLNWSMSVEGGFFNLIKKEYTGSVNIMPGAETSVGSEGIIFGFGPVDIGVRAGFNRKFADGFIIGPFIIIF